ncbi:MAG: hypothetical protein ACFN4W_09685 [Segatella oris]
MSSSLTNVPSNLELMEKKSYLKPSVENIKIESERQLCAGSPTRPTEGGNLEPADPSNPHIMTSKAWNFSFDTDDADDER